MSLEGTIVNGLVVLDGNPQLPEGARVRLEIEDEGDVDLPLPTETYEEHLAILRQSIADMDAGVKGMPLDEAMAKISAEFNLPPVKRG